MATRLQIINGALAQLADDRLASFEDENPDDTAQTAQDVYPIVREKALVESSWSWLYERKALQPDAWPERDQDDPYRYRFQFPVNETLRALYLQRSSLSAEVEGWERQGRYVYANRAPIWYDAQLQGVDESQWPPAFVYAVMQDILAHIAFASTWDLPTKTSYEHRAEMAYDRAKTLDAQGTPNESVQHFEWDQARVGGWWGERIQIRPDPQPEG